MTVYIGTIISQSQAGFDRDGGGLKITQGVGLLDLRNMDWTVGDWSRDTIEWQLDPGSVKWSKPLTAGLIVFPLTFDVAANDGASSNFGWGIDSFWLENVGNRTNRFDIRAALVLKTRSVEMLRIGWQLTVAA